MTEDIDTLGFNTAIAQMMIFINECYKAEKVNRDMMIGFIKLLSPIAPHICEEMYHAYTGEQTLAYASWPTYDAVLLEMSNVTIAVQVNGKLRGKFDFPKDSAKEDVEKEALALESVRPFIEGKEIRKVVVVPNKIINIVAK